MTEPSAAPSIAPSNQCELYAVELKSTRWEAMVAWYRQVLGVTSLIRVADEGYALLMTGGTRLAIVARKDVEPASGRITLAFEAADLAEAIERVKQSGAITTEPVTNPEGLTEVTTADPDGNRVRLFSWPRSQ